MAVDVTSIKIRKVTWRELQALRSQPGETMDDVVTRLLVERERREESGQDGREAS